jgi:hypothetical protein
MPSATGGIAKVLPVSSRLLSPDRMDVDEPGA